MEEHGRIQIWFFIGALLALYGLLIFGVGMYQLAVPPPAETRVKLFEYHADIWWGLVMAIVGVVYLLRFWPQDGTEG